VYSFRFIDISLNQRDFVYTLPPHSVTAIAEVREVPAVKGASPGAPVRAALSTTYRPVSNSAEQ
jgi:hypothetical protein